MSNGNTYLLLNAKKTTAFGNQLLSGFVAVESTTLKEGETLTVTKEEYNTITWRA